MGAPRRAAFVEESAEVEVLYANLEKMKSLTKKIQASMGRLETSGKTVQEAIGPIYGNTQKLQTTNTNIDRIIQAIDRIREPLDMRNKEERILKDGPRQAGLAEYMASIDRTRQALRDLKHSNLRSNQQTISELNGLLRVGNQRLEDVFREILQKNNQKVEPLHYITKNLEFPRLSQDQASQLRTINAHVASSTAELAQADPRWTPTAKIYGDIRGQYLTSSLETMAAACVATAKRTRNDAPYKRRDNAIEMYTQGIRAMYTAEYDNICPIFSRDEWGTVLKLTCQSSLNAFASTLRDLDKQIRENLTLDCFLAYEIVDVVSKTSFYIEERTGNLKYEISDAMKPVRETAKSSLSYLITDIRTKAQQMLQLPGDGSSVPLTPEVMTRLQMMVDYLSPLSSIMTSLGDGNWTQSSKSSSTTSIPTMKSFDVGADGRQLFAHYATDTIETLLQNLDSRSRAVLKGKSLQGVFLANNIAVIDRMIRSSDLQPILGSLGPKIEVWRKKAAGLYLDSWKEASVILLDVQYTNRTPRPPSTGQAPDSAAILKQLSGKDKDQIKEKFKNFNVLFDELVARHKSFRMEKEVRTGLAKEVQSFINALYVRFWDRYHEVDKGKGKYVKYDKGQLNAVLASLG
ncbi:exocyst complex component exo70 [Zalaria obscura]|uniref:Exocyst complex component exo70 n=1 Tax=Zalaria obscura TaxID=2024903 RepID=A0ACC3SPI6_9PEZI